MDKDTQEKFKRLQQWADSLARKTKTTLANMQASLDGDGKDAKRATGCPSKEVEARMEFRGIEKKLMEVIAAFADVEKTLFPEIANRHVFTHACTSGNKLRGQVTTLWEHRPSAEDEQEALPWLLR